MRSSSPRRGLRHRRPAAALHVEVLEARRLLATFEVSSTDDDSDALPGDGLCATAFGTCTLRAALEEANALPGLDTINFRIPGDGIHTITLTVALPEITDPVTIDGTSQAGFEPRNPSPVIAINGARVGSGGFGFRVVAGDSTVRGLALVGFPGDAIQLVGPGGNRIAGNLVGTDPMGAPGRGNLGNGVAILDSPQNTIGGTAAAERNVLAGFGAVSFSRPFSFPAGARTSALAAGDFNGDGATDLATADGDADTVSVLLARRDGSFAPRASYAVGPSPAAVAVGDFDGDRALDIVAANLGTSQVSVLLNVGDGSGTFLPFVPFAVGQPPAAVAVGDFNGDGADDIVTANLDPGQVSLLLNAGDGSGTFLPFVPFEVGQPPASVAVGDVDGDGELDIVTANRDADPGTADTVSVLLGQGDGTFATVISSPAGLDPDRVAVGDFDGDGRLDVAITSLADDSDRVRILRGRGDGSFLPADTFPVGEAAQGVLVGDFNGDAAPDLATENLNSVSILLNDGRGGFRAPDVRASDQSPSGLAAGDFNGDGRLDIATANDTTDNVSVFVNAPRGGNGVLIAGAAATGNVVVGNFIGTDVTGTARLGNGSSGVAIVGAPANTIGGSADGARNLIAGNLGSGVLIRGVGAAGNVIRGNRIGTVLAGDGLLRNAGHGVEIVGAPGNLVGGADPGAGNVISGNLGSGVLIHGTGAAGNRVVGNAIGTDATGTAGSDPSGTQGLGNRLNGVAIVDAPANTVGGASAPERNVIAGNFNNGVVLQGRGASGNRVAGNSIGTDAAGTRGLGNVFNGVTIVDAPGNTVGGPEPGAGNLISGNGPSRSGDSAGLIVGSGVVITGPGAEGNRVAGNFIGTDGSGTRGLGNILNGVVIEGAPRNTVGGTAAGEGNLIAGNFQNGIVVQSLGATDNRIAGNLIGTVADGARALGNVFNGVTIVDAPGNLVGGPEPGARNVISGNTAGAGLAILGPGAARNRVAGNFIGTTAAGNRDLGNRLNGVAVEGAPDNTVGGATAADRNVISGNFESGVILVGRVAAGNQVLGNFIGTDASGTIGNDPSGFSGLGNRIHGVSIIDAPRNAVGGPGAGNVIASNFQRGVFIFDRTGLGQTTGNRVQGNSIGTDATGTAGLGNGQDGVFLFEAGGNTVGGTEAGARNLIAGNRSNGILVSGRRARGNQVLGNFIGIDATGALGLANQGNGVAIVDAASNIVGGAGPGAGNVIAGNVQNGVLLSGAGAMDNRVVGNAIGTNAAGTAALGNLQHGVAILNATSNVVGGGPGAGNRIAGNGLDGVLLIRDRGTTTGNFIVGNTLGAESPQLIGLGNLGNGVTIEDAPGNTVAENTIAGNRTHGVRINGAGAANTLVRGNRIGTDRMARVAVGNGAANDATVGIGVFVRDAPGATIGGASAADRNVIAGNNGDGVRLFGPGAAGAVVAGNLIGTDGAGLAGLPNASDGVRVVGLGAGSSVLRGNVIGANAGAGIEVTGAQGTVIQANRIGINAAGAPAVDPEGRRGNQVGVLLVGEAATTIGGTAAVARNVISGNREDGIRLGGPGARGIAVLGNVIGTDPDGLVPVPNGTGVSLVNAGANTIGGTAPGAGNLIAGNAGAGVQLVDPGAAGNLLLGNSIGAVTPGGAALGNDIGVLLVDARGNTVGGTAPGAGNVISGNRSSGVQILDARGPGDASGNLVAGNLIGTDAAGTAPVPNDVGVLLDGAPRNLVGPGNVISGNLAAGVRIVGAGASGNRVQGNRIGTVADGTAAILAGSSAARQDQGVLLSAAPGNVVAENVLSGNLIGVQVVGQGATGNLVQTNLIGTNAAGTAPVGNVVGVLIDGVPGIAVEARNVISGNDSVGVQVVGREATGIVVRGNFIGTDVTGTGPILEPGLPADDPESRQGQGIFLSNAPRNTIQDNVISANGEAGVFIFGAEAEGNRILGNDIGVAFGGQRPLGNLQYGVLLFNAPENGSRREITGANRVRNNGLGNFREFTGRARPRGVMALAGLRMGRRPS